MLAAALLLQATALPACRPVTTREPTRTITGVWVDWFESSRFVEGATGQEKIDWRAPAVPLNVDARTAFRMRNRNRSHDYRLYRVTFRGFRSVAGVTQPCRPAPDFTPVSYTVETLVDTIDLGPVPH